MRIAPMHGTRDAVLLGLADVLADHSRKVDALEIELELPRDVLCGDSLAGPAPGEEQRGDPATLPSWGGTVLPRCVTDGLAGTRARV